MKPGDPTPGPSPQDEMEARLTAALLGELTPEETAALQAAIAKDPALAQLQERLRQTIGLVREAVHSPAEGGAPPVPEMQLNSERREKLLASFKVIPPQRLKHARQKARRRIFSAREWGSVAAMAAAVVVLGAIVVSLNSAQRKSNVMAGEELEVKLVNLSPAEGFKHSLERFDSAISPPRAKLKPRRTEAMEPGRALNGAPKIDSGLAADSSASPLAVRFGQQKEESAPAATGSGTLTLGIAAPAASPGVAGAEPSQGSAAKNRTPGSQNIFLPTEVYSIDSVGFSDKGSAVAQSHAQRRSGSLAPQSGSPAPITGPVVAGSTLETEQAWARPQSPTPVPPAPAVPPALTQTQPGEFLSFRVNDRESSGKKSEENLARKEPVTDQPSGTAMSTNVTFAFALNEGKSAFGGGGGGGGGFGGQVMPAAPPAVNLFDSQEEQRHLARDMSQSRSGLTANDSWGLTPPTSSSTPNARFFQTPVPGRQLNELETVAAIDGYTGLPAQGIPVLPQSRADSSSLFEPAQQSANTSGTKPVAQLGEQEKGQTTQLGRGFGVEGPGQLGGQRFRGQLSQMVNRAEPAPQDSASLRAGQAGEARGGLDGENRRQETQLAEKDSRREPIPGSVPQTKSGPEGLATAEAASAEAGGRRQRLADVEAKNLTQSTDVSLPSQDEKGSRVTVVKPDASPPAKKESAAGAVAQNGATGAAVRLKGELHGETSIELLSEDVPKLRENQEQAPVAGKPVAGEPAAQSASGQQGAELAKLKAVKTQAERDEDRLAKTPARPIRTPPPSLLEPQPEVQTADNAFSTFSLNVSDVSFKLAAAALEKGTRPDPGSIRSEEFINAFDYRDPEPGRGVPIAFAFERARYPFAHNRDLIRFSLKTAALGRQSGRPLNLVLLLDNSGSMERADRVQIIRECLRVLATQLRPEDRISVVAFARTPRLWIDGLPGSQAAELGPRVGGLTPEGGTNLEDALNLAYQTALRHYLPNGINRVVLLTDGAANLGEVDPASLQQKVETHRREGVALDCFGIGWEGYNDDLLETLSRHGDGRYGFVNTPGAAANEFAGQLAGALRVAASDVKVQVEFNPQRVTAYRQIGYAKHQLKKEQFRDNTVDAAEIGAAEAGNALYVVEVNLQGEGPIGTVRVRFKDPGTARFQEREWLVPFTGTAVPLEQASPALRLAASAAAFSEMLASNPFAAEVTADRLSALLRGVPESYGADPRPKKLEWMIRQAK